MNVKHFCCVITVMCYLESAAQVLNLNFKIAFLLAPILKVLGRRGIQIYSSHVICCVSDSLM
jgi:hypothetical protein